jgi:hypothetical protein
MTRLEKKPKIRKPKPGPPIGRPGDRLVERSHEPADGPQALANNVQALGVAEESECGALHAGRVVAITDGAEKNGQPSLGNFSVRPLPGHPRIAAQNHVEMIAHDCVRIHGHRKAVSQLVDPTFDPLAAVLEAFA